jgi:ELWxxDGT repeat protein
MKRSSLAALLLAIAAPVALPAQTAYLVKDLNATRSGGASSRPEDFTGYKGRVYFSAYTPSADYEVWSTDGTEAGTIQVSNLPAVSNPTRPRTFRVVGGNLVFNASDSHGEELWVTDGTREGTRLMADVNAGTRSSFPSGRIVYHDKMLFAANDGIDGSELWITDGTPAGTRFFKDLVPGLNGSDPHSFVLFHDLIYFLAAGQLWKSDGTEAGTVAVAPISSLDILVAGDRLFFVGYTEQTGAEPWVSDGTAAGTHMIADLVPGSRSSTSSSDMNAFGDRVLFLMTDVAYHNALWISDGTTAGTHQLSDVVPGGGNFLSSQLAVLNGVAIFSASTPEYGAELWRTDGTAAGTVLVRDIEPGTAGSGARGLITVGNKVFFAATQNGKGAIWTTDGTAAGTQIVSGADSYVTLSSLLVNIDGTVWFSAANALNGFEPWKTDGTTAGTRMVANLSKDPAPNSDPGALVAAGDQLYFLADDATTPVDNSMHRSLFRTDGTSEGTLKLFHDIGSLEMSPVGRSLFFRTNELWKSDGTPETTGPATEWLHRFPGTPFIPTAVGDTLLTLVHIGNYYDTELFATKLAPGSPVVDLGVESGGGFTNYAGRTIFLSGKSLFTTDGTRAGTYEFARLDKSAQFSNPTPVVRGQFFFVSYSDTLGVQLWKSDGTFEGTVAVKSIPGLANLTAAGGNLFFMSGSQLGVTDGTDAGTHLLPANPETPPVAAGDRVVFMASDPANGSEPWVSDGTDAGTRLLRDLVPGALGSDSAYFTAAGPRVYFRAYDDAHGYELWVTDGTPEGTTVAADVEPGPRYSNPRDLTVAGNRLYFDATTSATGRELWALPLPSSPSLTIDDTRASESNAYARFTVRLSSASTQNVSVDFATADNVAIAGSDSDAKSGTLVFAPGETAKTIDVPLRADTLSENNESFRLLLRNATGAIVARSEGAAIIEDDDQLADLALSLDYTFLYAGGVKFNVTNNGPRAATNVVLTGTVTPIYLNGFCNVCSETIQLLSGETFSNGAPTASRDVQQYYTMTAHAVQRDPQLANNTVAWTAKGPLVMEAHQLTPGADAKVSFYDYGHAATVSVESSNPAVLTVLATVPGQQGETAGSFMIHAVSIGHATLRVFTTQGTLGTLDVDVLAPGTKVRWPGAITAFGNNTTTPFERGRGIYVDTNAMVPFTAQTATGLVTVVSSANGRELGRVLLTPDVHHYDLEVYATQMGDEAIEFRYAGDDNFLPMTVTSRLISLRGNVSITTTTERSGSTATVRVRVAGSPGSTPTGTIAISEGSQVLANGVTLTQVRLGLAEAVIPLTNVTPGTHTLTLEYTGDEFYYPVTQSTRITEDRRRGSRH